MKIYSLALQKHISATEIFLLFLLTLSMYCSDLSSVTFQPDETFWISTGTRLDYFFDYSAPVWEENWGNYEIRPLPSYIVRIGQKLGGAKDIPVNYWDWSRDRETNIASNRMPNERVLYFSRLPMAIIAVISILVATTLITMAHSRMAGYIFLITSCFNEYFLLHLRRSMSESPLLLFTILAITTIYKLQVAIKDRDTRSVLLWAILSGLFSGFAGQSKLTGLACGILAIVVSFATIYRFGLSNQVIGIKIFRTIAVIVPAITTIVFMGFYPFFYESTLLRIAGTFSVRQSVLKSQLVDYSSQVILPNQRLGILLDRVFDYPYYSASNHNLLMPSIILFLAGFGVYHCAKSIIVNRIDTNVIYMTFLIGMIVLGVPMLATPLDWNRYYLYPVFLACIFASIGLAQIFFLITKNNSIKLATS